MAENRKELANIFSSELRDAVIRMRLTMDVQLEYLVLKAKLQKAEYDALVDNGFTPEQALELCKKV